ncbi:hypothetical protein U1769_00330 [Sphingomonas sp. ZT3P38]|uniref:hypothetical protein n=1 Tax=Parasphingomonas zepuensis TaxID=3096161 RepID=UPI002FC72082
MSLRLVTPAKFMLIDHVLLRVGSTILRGRQKDIACGRAIMIIAVLAMFALLQKQPATSEVPTANISIPSAAEAGRMIPAGTPVQIEITEEVKSRTAKIGDHFAIRLAAPIVVDGTTIVPVGTLGTGEVIHASHVRFMTNRPGELIVAARYLDLGNAHLPLRGFRIDRSGASGTVFSTVGPIAIAHNVDIPAGAIAVAKVATDFIVPAHAAGQLETRK